MKLTKFIIGLGVGVVAGMLVAPKKGSELVEDIKTNSKKVYDKTKNLTKEDVIDAISKTSDKLKIAVEEFDSDKAKATTREKIDTVKTSIDELVQKAKENETCQDVLTRIETLSTKAMEKIAEYKEKVVEYGTDISEEVEEELDEFKDEIDEIIEEMDEDSDDSSNL